jgi:hypothetical protein
LVCFFLVMDVRKKIAQRPVGQINKQQPDADLDAGAYNHTSRRRQSPPLRPPRQRAALKSRPAFVPSNPSRNHPPWLYLAGSLARSRSPVRSRQTPSLTVGMTQWRSPLWTQIGVLALLTCRFRPYNEVMHPNKYIREALQYAASQGWRVMKAGPRAHIWGTIYCHESSRDGCRFHIYSTPRNPQNHARAIRRAVDACSH